MTVWITKTKDFIDYCIWHWLRKKDVRKMLKLQKELIETSLATWEKYTMHWVLDISMKRVKLRDSLWDYAMSPKAQLTRRFRHNNIKYDKHWASWK